jgi:hypothetical protein
MTAAGGCFGAVAMGTGQMSKCQRSGLNNRLERLEQVVSADSPRQAQKRRRTGIDFPTSDLSLDFCVPRFLRVFSIPVLASQGGQAFPGCAPERRTLNSERRTLNVKGLERDLTASYLFYAIGLKRKLLGPIETLGSLWCSIQRDERSRTRSALELAWKGEGRRTFTVLRSQGRCFRPKGERGPQGVLG